MTLALLKSLGLSLALTIVLETGFFLLIGLVTRVKPHCSWSPLCQGKRDKKDILLVVLVNVFTNPIVVLLYWLAVLYTDWNSIIILIPLELFAVLAEGCLYKKYGRGFRCPYLFSLAANIFSFGLGLLIQFFL